MIETYLKILVGAPVLAIASILIGLSFKGLDRKIHAQMQWRVGPPLLQPFYDTRKLLTKKNLVPENAIPWLFNLMPILALVSAIAVLFYIPIGDMEPILSGHGDLIVILYLLSIHPLAISIGGFASGSPYSSIGSQREIVMMMAYEFPLAITIATIAWATGGQTAFSLATISSTPIWGIVGPIGVVGLVLLLAVLLIVAPAELAKVPFDIAEAEQELAGGSLAEYSGKNLAMFYLADAVKTIAFAAVIVSIFFPYQISTIIGITGLLATIANIIFFLLKISILMFVAVTFVRTAFARIKIDQFSSGFLGIVSAISLIGLIMVWIGGI